MKTYKGYPLTKKEQELDLFVKKYARKKMKEIRESMEEKPLSSATNNPDMSNTY